MASMDPYGHGQGQKHKGPLVNTKLPNKKLAKKSENILKYPKIS